MMWESARCRGRYGRTTLRREHPGRIPGDRGCECPVQGCRRGQGRDNISLLTVPAKACRCGEEDGLVHCGDECVRREQGQEEAGCLVLCVCSRSSWPLCGDPSVGTRCSEPVLTWPPLGARETGRREKARGQDGRQEGCIFSRFDRIIVG